MGFVENLAELFKGLLEDAASFDVLEGRRGQLGGEEGCRGCLRDTYHAEIFFGHNYDLLGLLPWELFDYTIRARVALSRPYQDI